MDGRRLSSSFAAVVGRAWAAVSELSRIGRGPHSNSETSQHSSVFITNPYELPTPATNAHYPTPSSIPRSTRRRPGAPARAAPLTAPIPRQGSIGQLRHRNSCRSRSTPTRGCTQSTHSRRSALPLACPPASSDLGVEADDGMWGRALSAAEASLGQAELVSLLVSRKVEQLRAETDELLDQLELDQDPGQLVLIQDLIGVSHPPLRPRAPSPHSLEATSTSKGRC